MVQKSFERGYSSRSPNPELISVEESLIQGGYAPDVIENYPRLLRMDMHLAEFYRLANAPGNLTEGKKINVNPIQASIDKEGRILVDVVAELKKGVTVEQIQEIMKVHARSGGFVAGRILASRAHELIGKADHIETSRPIAATAFQSVPSIQADQATLAGKFPTAARQDAINGRGVIIGIIDHGCDIKHEAFRNEDGSTRLLFVWDQTGHNGPLPAAPFDYGVEYDKDSIDQALASQTELPIPLERNAHGTHVMGIAAGGSPQFPGVAPAADLIFVHLGKAANQEGQAGAPEEEELKSFGSSWNLFNAVAYIFEKAGERPVVINISQGANGGPHDGTTMIERMFDQELVKGGRAIVIAAGNSRDDGLNTAEDGIHTSGEIPPGGKKSIAWRIDKASRANSEVRHEIEIWYELGRDLTLRILDPFNVVKGECRFGEEKNVGSADGLRWPILMKNSIMEKAPGIQENLINVFVDNRGMQVESEPPPVWLLELAQSGEARTNIRYHAWIERNDPAQSTLAMDSQPSFTLNTIANASLPIVVGAYDSHANNFPGLVDSGEGPTRNPQTNTKPDLSAPGWRIFSANAQTSNNGVTKSGTSMAAPHVSGVIALLFQAARDRKQPSKTLTINEIRDLLISTADKNPPVNEGHHTRYGFGRINAAKALSKLLE